MSSKPYVQTYTAVVGNQACDANCPYCISKTTVNCIDTNSVDVNWRNFLKGAKLSRDWGASTFLITGKGEPTLHPKLVLEFIMNAKDAGFPIIEIQTKIYDF